MFDDNIYFMDLVLNVDLLQDANFALLSKLVLLAIFDRITSFLVIYNFSNYISLTCTLINFDCAK